MPEPEFRGTPRFEIRRTLGAGGMGVVYEALDRERGERVALKTFRSSGPMSLLRLKNEFRGLQDLHHPNLVGLGELFETEGRWFFSMELIDGCSFLDYVCPGRVLPPVAALDSTVGALDLTMPSATGGEGVARPNELTPQYDLGRLRASLRQLAAGLHALHAAKKVHRDVKPSNILVEPDGRVVLLDFGLIIDEHRATDDILVGTAAYMAPEQAAGRMVGPPADWYSVGVMLYQVLAAQLPFVGISAEIMERKQHTEPPPPSAVAHGVPDDLDQLCVELLRIDPRARPRQADILRRLDVEMAPLSRSAGAPLFVGRRQELDALHAAFGEVQRGRAVTVLVHGESGVGKSALVREFTAELAAAGVERCLTLAGRCYERESVPYKAVDEIVDGLEHHLRSLPPEELDALLPPSAPLLAQAFPMLRRLPQLAEVQAPANLDPQERRTRLFAALRALLARLAQRERLLLSIDDLQWADSDSLALLREVLAPPDAPALLLVATVRTAGTDEALERLQLGAPHRVRVASLPPAEARELALHLLQQTESGRDDRMLAAIVDEAGGHPLFIDELVRNWEGHGRRRVERVRLDDALWSRIRRLDPGVRQVLELVAVAGGPLPQRTVAAEVSDATEFMRQVTELRTAHLVRTAGAGFSDNIETYHDRVRESILANLDPTSLRQLHTTLARALEARGGADPEVLANHWSGAGNRERAARYSVQAAEQANAALAFDRAARLYRAALVLGASAPSDETQSLRKRLAVALANAGRGRDAAEAFLVAVEHADEAEALDYRRCAAEQLLRSGHFEEGMALLRRVLAASGMRMAATPTRALLSLLTHRARVRLRGLRFVERAAADVPAEELTRVDLFWLVAATLAMVDNIRAADFQSRGLVAALDAGEPFRVTRALCAEACFAASAGGAARVRVARLLALADEHARRVDHPYTHAWAALAHGVSAYLVGEWRRCFDSCARAEEIFRECTGSWWEVSTAQLYQIFTLFYLGRVGDQTRQVNVSLREARDRGDLLSARNVRKGLAVHIWLADDDPARARLEVGETMEKTRDVFFFGHYWSLLAELQIELYEGNAAAAQRLLDERWPALKRSLLLRVEVVNIEAWHMRARCALATAITRQGRARARALRDAEQGARVIAATQMPWARPLAELVRAAVAAARGAAADAVARLDAAIADFDACEMGLYAAAARWRRGELVGGTDGAAAIATADAWMAAQSIRNPQRTTQLLAPGF